MRRTETRGDVVARASDEVRAVDVVLSGELADGRSFSMSASLVRRDQVSALVAQLEAAAVEVFGPGN